MNFFIRQSQSQLIIRKVIAVFHILADLQQNLSKRIRRLFFYHIADLIESFTKSDHFVFFFALVDQLPFFVPLMALTLT